MVTGDFLRDYSHWSEPAGFGDYAALSSYRGNAEGIGNLSFGGVTVKSGYWVRVHNPSEINKDESLGPHIIHDGWFICEWDYD